MRGALAVLLFAAFAAAAGHAAPAACRLSPADMAANRRMGFEDFDQKGSAPSAWRALEERGCHAEAAAAADDYLANGPVLEPHYRSVVVFHEAQSLAMMGDNAGAARLVAAAMPADRKADARIDWTTYLVGTHAFLVRDRAGLQIAFDTLSREPGPSNATNAGVLKGLIACHGQSYEKASELRCRR